MFSYLPLVFNPQLPGHLDHGTIESFCGTLLARKGTSSRYPSHHTNRLDGNGRPLVLPGEGVLFLVDHDGLTKDLPYASREEVERQHTSSQYLYYRKFYHVSARQGPSSSS
jgi:hypothetical protein